MPTVERLAFSVNGQTDRAWEQDLQEIIIENSLRMPSMCTICLYDGAQPGDDFTYMESPTFVLGAVLKAFVLDKPDEVVFEGEIVALEPIFEQSGRSSLIVRAYDKMHRLHRGKHTRTWKNVTYTDTIASILGETGLPSGTLTNTAVQHDFLIQNNQTNMEWISMVAHMLGYQFYMEVGKFHFKKPEQFEDALVDLTWREELRSFRPHVAIANQPTEVSVYAWDQLTKRVIEGKAQLPAKSSASLLAVTQNSASTSRSKFGAAISSVVTVPVPNQNAAKDVATGQAADVEGEFVRADGISLGSSKIKIGRFVSVKGAGKYSGKYFVTNVRHIYRYDGRWETHFYIDGRGPSSLLSTLRGGEHEIYNNRISGVVPALVTNSLDPTNLGRVKVKYPAWPKKNGTEVESDWVRVVAPSAGKDRGFFWIPEVDDEVLVAFEYGDPHRPYIVGALWNQKDAPPLRSNVAAPSGVTEKRIMKSRTGHIVLIDDSAGASKIQILDKTGKNEILIDTVQNSISLTAERDITLSAKGNITLDAKGKVAIKSVMDTTITAMAAFKVDANAPSQIKILTSMTIDSASVTVKGQALVSITSLTMTEVESSGLVVVQGALIKLN